MSLQLPRATSLTIAMFYPSNSLMHQVSNWASDRPNCDFQLHFPKLLDEMRGVLRRRQISIIDATDDRERALAAFVYAILLGWVDAVAVYTEVMHEGIELFVRSHGVLLLPGPMRDVVWEELFEAMGRDLARKRRHGFSSRQPIRSDTDHPPVRPWMGCLKDSLKNQFRRTA
ncbi:MAG: hypothetical protein A2V70_08240 [Planctomycetes bacterium RBG_13_63_9]|nr:MAG: hypothetical protein A2V70_08240 [Planctomycetes bacterium RBG_13_63_9]